MNVREVEVRYKEHAVPATRSTECRDPKFVAALFEDMALEPVEILKALYLDGRNKPIAFQTISQGTLSKSLVHPREVFWSAVYHRANAVIVVHNHPSGDPSPSREDVSITQQLKAAGDVLGIHLLDHVIIGADGTHCSLRDRGLL